ncbi:MAG: glycoside hydrolase family 31 protein [Candidatus Binatia bacterium]
MGGQVPVCGASASWLRAAAQMYYALRVSTPNRRFARVLLTMALTGMLAACDDAESLTPPAVTVTRLSDRIRIQTPAAMAEIHFSPYRLVLLNLADASVVTSEHDAGGVFYERANTQYQLTQVRSDREVANGTELTVDTTEGGEATATVRFLTARTVEVTVVPPQSESVTALGDRWDTPDDEVIYGLTERLRDSKPSIGGVLKDDIQPVEVGSLNRRGETVEMFIRPTFSLYAPFYQSSRGYGLNVAGTMAGLFDVAKTDPNTISFHFETGTTAASHTLVFHLFFGPDHATILDEYTALTGRPFVPPGWAFLHWRWRDELAIGPPASLDGVPINAQVAEDVTMYEQLGIPPGVYHFDRPVLQGEFGFARFAWDESRLPNSQAMLASLRARGYRILTWSATWACGSRPDDNGADAKQLGFLAPGSTGTPMCADVGGGSFILDVTNPAMREWWRDKVRDFVASNDISGIKLDRGEEHIPSDATDIWADGRNGREVHNDYPNLQAQIHYDALAAARGTDFLVIARPGYTGTQRYAIFWGGDIPGSQSFGLGPGTDLGLRSCIISQQRAAFMGFPIWGSDTGGYYEFKDREVFARWIEFSAFSGIMEIGGTGNHAPWNMPTQPQYDQELIDIYRRYTQLRAILHDYIVRFAGDAARGMPMVRPLVFLDRSDPTLRDLWDQYLFGPDLMVAPVWKSGQRSRSVYFPSGTWTNYWDRTQQYQGRNTVTQDVPLDTIPVFIRAGAQVPPP